MGKRFFGMGMDAEGDERRLVIARVAELAFFLITLFFAGGLASDGAPGERMILARLMFEAALALGIFLALGIRPGPARIAGVVLAAYVLVGCMAGLAHLPERIAAATDASAVMALVLVLAGCACQAVALLTCLPPRKPKAGS